MKYLHYYFCFLFQLTGCLYGNDPIFQDLSYESLAADLWTDHVRSFQQLFKIQKINSFLEFGVGKGTKFFLDNCQSVTSIELVVESRQKDVEPWYEKCCDFFKNYTNWNPSMHVFSSNFDQADQRAHEQLDPEEIDGAYLTEINLLCDQIFQSQKFDLAFVDPGIHIRGDIVNALFDRVDIIVAHDTACTLHQMFGYYKVRSPNNYVKLVSKYGSGTTFWIKKDKIELIQKLRMLLPAFEANP